VQVSLVGINTTPKHPTQTAHELVSILADSSAVQRVVVLGLMHIPTAAEGSLHDVVINQAIEVEPATRSLRDRNGAEHQRLCIVFSTLELRGNL
jgi:hypothetical protein